MPLEMMLAWWNLVYAVPFALALIYLGLFVFTGITFGDTDVDADVDADVDTDVHVSVEAHVVDADADADHDVAVGHDADTEQPGMSIMPHAPEMHTADVGTSAHPVMAFLTLLGVGKIPVSLALMIFLLCWGVVGFALNTLLVKGLGATVVVGIISLPITLIVSLTFTGLGAAAIGRIIPSDDGTKHRRQDLVGKAGEAIYDIDSTFGMATVRGEAGDFFQIPCRTVNGTGRIPKGSRVVIFDYDRQKGVFHVAPFEAA